MVGRADDVEVAFVVGGVVARFAHKIGDELEEGGGRDAIAAVMHGADAAGIQSR